MSRLRLVEEMSGLRRFGGNRVQYRRWLAWYMAYGIWHTGCVMCDVVRQILGGLVLCALYKDGHGIEKAKGMGRVI